MLSPQGHCRWASNQLLPGASGVKDVDPVIGNTGESPPCPQNSRRKWKKSYTSLIRKYPQITSLINPIHFTLFLILLEVYREFQPSNDIFHRSGAKGCLDHRYRAGTPILHNPIANPASTQSQQPGSNG